MKNILKYLNKIQSFFKKSNKNVAILIILLFAICLLPKIVSAISHQTDAFAYNHSSLAYVTIQDGALPNQPYQNTGDTVHRLTNSWTPKFIPHAMISCISMMTGLPPEQIQFLPWGGVLLIVGAFALAYTLFRSKLYAAAFTLFFSIEPVVNGLTYNTYQQGWSYLFYFLLMAVVYHIMSKKYEKSSLKLWLQAGFLGVLLYIGVFFTYYSSNLYSILFLFIFLPIVIWPRLKNKKVKIISIISITLILALITLLEPSVWYVLSLYGSDKLTNVPAFIYQYLLSVFGLGDAPTGGEGALGLPSSSLILYLGLFLYTLILLPILYYLLKGGLKLIRQKPRIISPMGAFFLAIFFTGVIDTLLYFALGIVSYKYILLLFPLLVLITIYSRVHKNSNKKIDNKINKYRRFFSSKPKTNRSAIAAILVTLLIVIAGVKFVLNQKDHTDKTFSSTEQAVTWFENYTSVDNGRYISDLLTGEKLLVQFTRDEFRDMNLFVLRPENSGFLNEFDPELKEVFNRSRIQYFILSPISVGEEKSKIRITETPLADYTFLNKVYGDGSLAIFYYSN
jgi:hypothetical protein